MTDRTDELPGFNPDARRARAKRIPICHRIQRQIGMLIFYVGLTPVWIGLRGAAWVAELRSRRRRARNGPPPPASAGE